MEDRQQKLLDRRVTRRDAIKAGGLAALGLAFAKPVIETIHPKPIFATGGTGMPCTGTARIDNLVLQVEASDSSEASDKFRALKNQQLDSMLICAGNCPPGQQCFVIRGSSGFQCEPSGVNLFTCTMAFEERNCLCGIED